MTAMAMTSWTPAAAGQYLAGELTARFVDGQGWQIDNAPERLVATVHGLVWFAENLGCELICPHGAHGHGLRCHGHLPHNPQPGERIVVGTRGVGSRVVYRVEANLGAMVQLVEERAA